MGGWDVQKLLEARKNKAVKYLPPVIQMDKSDRH